MFVYGRDYKGCELIIREIETNNIIAKTTIDDYNRTDMAISISEEEFSLEGISHVLLEVFQEDSVCQFMGTVRKMKRPPLRQLSLFRGRIITDRRAKRYPVKTFATIHELIFGEVGGEIERLTPPVKVQLLNISSNGVLLRTNCDFLSVGLSYKMEIEQNDIFINATIVRAGKGKKEREREFGCCINYIYE